MNKMIRNTLLSLFCLVASMVYGGIPAMNVSVSDESGKAAFKGTTSSSGTFATAKLKPGKYVVQLNAQSSAVKGNHYAVVVSAGTKKVAASAVPGEKFNGGGVALKVDVGNGLNITGQVAEESKTAMKDGKKMVWIPPALGSNMPGRWVPEDSAEAKTSKNRLQMSVKDVQRIQENQNTNIAPGRDR
jgi:polysaccharide lyase family 4-like protein